MYVYYLSSKKTVNYFVPLAVLFCLSLPSKCQMSVANYVSVAINIGSYSCHLLSDHRQLFLMVLINDRTHLFFLHIDYALNIVSGFYLKMFVYS